MEFSYEEVTDTFLVVPHVLMTEAESVGVQKDILHRYLLISMSYDFFLWSDKFGLLVHNKSGL